MTERVLCTGCGNALPSGSPGGLCPACLLRLALDGTQGEESTLAAPEGSSGPEDLGSVGPYRLLSILGEGGMGSVYLAEQSEPIRRRVALKVIKRGMDTKDVIARFESERQALALMSHPNIARVLDAGTTKDGLPYFVMEHVAGVPITEYCDKNRLDSRARLELFEPGVRGRAARPPEGDHPPGHQAVERAGVGGGGQAAAADHRLRRREGDRPAADGEDAVHAARA